ncbi:hypothetical protein PC113_g7330 [Phytophthora cactorum]|uniref:Uncharacterized protein n=2 Tax=Phytophthora cactorum TaxID=29920 RepID=A0A8T1D0N9_9STRA|nr:hypothetical protein PC113_g7330 [Phytophthora cactorum]KAG2931240.1 hypothetical protein PC115_g6192 [Phytophthora cactorum]
MPSVSIGKPQPSSTAGIRANARKPTHQTTGKGIRSHGNNSVLYVESEGELEAKRLAAQRAAMAVANRATAILKMQQQRDPDVLDLRPYAEELNDFLLAEMAHQLRANRSVTGYSHLILSRCNGFTPVGLRSLVHVVGETLRQLDCSCTTLSVPMLQVLATGIERLDVVDFSSCPQLLSEGLLQAAYRGYWTRRHFVLVRKSMERYRLEQSLLQREAAAARLQSSYRARFGRSHFEDMMTLNQRRRQEQHDAAVTLQRLFRTRATRRAYRQLRAAIARQLEEIREHERIAVKLQSNWRGHRTRQNEVIRVRAEAQARKALQYAAASRINAGVRGYFGRRYARSERVRAQTRYRAACVIQRAWRRYSETDSRQLELDVMLMRLRESALNEDAVARAQQEDILRKARDLANRDSASEPESDDDWRDFQDEYGDQFWFSPSRNERVYMRPNDHAREKSILEMPCRVLWPLEQRWFDGRITRYNWKKDRHRVDYDDGDHEWLNVLHADSSRVQLFNGHCWCMAPMLDTSKRALRAAIFVGVYFQRFDPRRMFWRSGTIRAYHESSDTFLLMYDPGNGEPPQYEQEWVSVFTTENHFQVQDAITHQWYSLSGYVFGHVRGQPLDLQMLQSKQNESRWYSVTDYLDYDEEAFVQVDDDTAAKELEVRGDDAADDEAYQVDSVNNGYTEDSGEDEDSEQESNEQDDED